MPNPSDYHDILVLCEMRDGKLAKSSLEVLTKARELADQIGCRVEALILGDANVESLAEQAIHMGADVVLTGENEALTVGNIDAFFAVSLPVVRERKPEIVLVSATPRGLDLAPRLGAALGTGALSDATQLEVDYTDRLLIARRLTYDGSVQATASIPEHRPQIASLRPGAVRPGFPDDMRYGRVEAVEATVPRSAKRVRLVSIEEEPPAPTPLDRAEIVVAGGTAFTREEHGELIGGLAKSLGGESAATRAAVQFGMADAPKHIGATGVHIKPKLYVAAGVSGAFEHYYGVKDSEVVIAINSDKRAPIFGWSHYGLIGDAKKIIPKILEELKRD